MNKNNYSSIIYLSMVFYIEKKRLRGRSSIFFQSIILGNSIRTESAVVIYRNNWNFCTHNLSSEVSRVPLQSQNMYWHGYAGLTNQQLINCDNRYRENADSSSKPFLLYGFFMILHSWLSTLYIPLSWISLS